MSPVSNLYFVLSVVTALTACGGSGGGGGIDPRLARLDAYEAQRLRIFGDPAQGVAGMEPTNEEAVPDSGTATFSGSTNIRVEAPEDPLILFGDASLTLAFGEGVSTGIMTRFFGQTAGGGIADYGGQITLTGGIADPASTMDYGGTLIGGGTTLTFDGMLTTMFLGNPIGAVVATDVEAAISENGTVQSGTIFVAVEGGIDAPQPPPD